MKTPPTFGELAYGAYSGARGGRAHDGSPLLSFDEMAPGLRAAWEAFAGAVLAGCSAEVAYSRSYLGSTGGRTADGGIAPSWAFFQLNNRGIQSAWEQAAVQVMTAASAP